MEKGYIKLSRKFFSNEMWKEARKFSECEAWLDLLQSARFEATDKAYSELIGGREISYSRGQYPASISFLMKRWQWSEKKVRLFLDKLKRKKMITTDRKQGMNVITICKYDEYNPVKDKAKGEEKDIDNSNEIKELHAALGELRAELRANVEKMGRTKGNKKKKDKEDNNTPPIPPKGEGINSKSRFVFESYVKSSFGTDYYWTPKDAGAMTKLLKKITFSREQKKMPIDDESLLYALQSLLSSIHDDWILKNFSVAIIDSKYNEIVTQAINGNNQKASISKQEANDYALQQYITERQRREQGLVDEVERPF